LGAAWAWYSSSSVDRVPVAKSADSTPARVLFSVPSPFSQEAEKRSSSILPNAGTWLRLRVLRKCR